MFLVKQQPRGYVNGNLIGNYISTPAKNILRDKLFEQVNNIFYPKVKGRNLVQLVTDGAILDSAIVLHNSSNFNDILFVCGKEDGVNGYNFTPVIHQVNKSAGSLYVAGANESFSKLYKEYGIHEIEMDDEFVLDTKKVRLKSPKKFNAVVLVGCKAMNHGKHNASHVKELFAPYCVEGFTLFDVYSNTDRVMTPEKEFDSEDFRQVKNATGIVGEDEILNSRMDYFKTVCKVY